MQSEEKSSRETDRPGVLTAAIGKWLRDMLSPNGYTVFYDHGSEDKGRIVCWFGEGEPNRHNRLSFPDIVIAQGKRVLVLIEIEDKTDRPKTLLGDAFGILMGDQIRCHGENMPVETGTTLIIMGKGTGSQHGSMKYLRERIEKTQACLGTKNASIGKIILDMFAGDQTDLEKKLQGYITTALPATDSHRA